MRVTVVGGTGVLGRRVVARLLKQGNEVVAPVRSDAAAARIPGAHAVVGNVWDPDFLRRSIDGCGAVMMLATAIPPGSSAARAGAWRTNDRIRSELAPTVARIAQDCGVGTLVQESVLFVYADGGDSPVSEDSAIAPSRQARSCLVAERAAHGFAAERGPQVTAVVLRFAQFVAPESEQTSQVLGEAQRGRVLILGSLGGYATFVHADDAAAAAVQALGIPSGVYNVGAEPVAKQQWRDVMSELVGRRVGPPPSFVRAALPTIVPMAKALERSIRLDSSRLTTAGWNPARLTARDVWADAPFARHL